MNQVRFFILFILSVFSIQCNESSSKDFPKKEIEMKGKGALLTTKFTSFEAFKEVVQIEYSPDRKSWVQLTHKNNGSEVISVLESGISESDIMQTRDGSFWDKVKLTLKSPYFVRHRMDLQRLFLLSRRRHKELGGGDIAFYDLAERMMYNISEIDLTIIPSEDISEKGFINTFNHINSQSFMTSIFSEELADFVADIHERKSMPELITGKFTEAQKSDIKNGAVDNYVDIINNEWGQELGKWLSKKYAIDRNTIWTPELLTAYLNDIQSYYSAVFQIGFKPFRASENIIITFANKINKLLRENPTIR